MMLAMFFVEKAMLLVFIQPVQITSDFATTLSESNLQKHVTGYFALRQSNNEMNDSTIEA